MNQITALYYRHNVNVQPRHIRKDTLGYYDLTVVKKGVLYYVCNDGIVSLKPGDIILMRPGEIRQRLDSTTYSDYASFNFYTDMDLSSLPGIIKESLNAEVDTLLIACDQIYDRMSENYLEETAYIVGALLFYLRENIANLQMKPLALKIKNYIQKNYAEKITLQSISEKFHFSASYCNSIFKKENNKPIVDYLIEERLRKAKELLVHTNLPLPQIAAKVGYEDYNYFSRLFKKNTCYTPMQYRKLYAK